MEDEPSGDSPEGAGISPLLEARGIGRRDTAGTRWLLRDVSLAIHAGERVALVGPTGSGKTLLLRTLARLDGLDAGQVLWRGETVSGNDVPRFRRQAIYLHQRPALLEGTVEENLRLPFTLKSNRSASFRRDVMLSLLRRVGRDAAFLQRTVRDLSGGEAQIVALARAIQLEPQILLLDEPTAALDEEMTRTIEALVMSWFDQSPEDRALVWVSHDPAQVRRIADRRVPVQDGRLTAQAAGEEADA